MAYTEKDRKAAEKAQAAYPGLIVGCYNGYIVLAHNKSDYNAKRRKIARGDRLGFYTVEHFLKENAQDNEEKETP